MIKVLIVDDSAFMRQVFKKKLKKHSGIKTVAVARNGKKALEKINNYNPDVITLDIEMPKMNGLKTLKRIKTDFDSDIQVIMVSALNNKTTVMDALELGAFDFIAKPSGNISLDIEEIMEDLIKKIKAAAKCSEGQLKEECSKTGRLKGNNTSNNRKKIGGVTNKKFDKNDEFPVIAIGASSGGPRTVHKLFKSFPSDFPAGIIVVQHMPAGFTRTFARRLNQDSNLEVVEAKDGDKIKKGKVFIAPGDHHLVVQNDYIQLHKKAKVFGVRPCVDYMMKSVAENFGERVIGVILTGMGKDGAEGMDYIQRYHGFGIVQDKESALVYGMPQAVIDLKAYDQICALDEIAEKLVELVGK